VIKAGIYIHIPFCKVKCIYCDFYSITERENSIERFTNAIIQEIKVCNVDVSKWEIDTIFFGGGSPSLLKGRQIEKIISALSKKYDLTNIIESSIEVNPGEVSLENLKLYKQFGINRLSVGVQSFQPDLLRVLTRNHNRKDIFEIYNNARSIGFENINLDLMHSIPGQTFELLEKDLNEIISLEPEHISAYSLTVEKNTELFTHVKDKTITMPNEDRNTKFYHNTVKNLTSHGYNLYEISSLSKPGMQCKHNLHYWNIEPYLGFGPSSHSYDNKYRWYNTKSLDVYLQNIELNKPVKMNEELLSNIDKVNETIGFGLRMSSGINLGKLPEKYRKKLKKTVKKTEQKFNNCFKKADHRIQLTSKGILYADEIIAELIF